MHSITNPTNDYISMQVTMSRYYIPKGLDVVIGVLVYVRLSNIGHMKILLWILN